MQVGNDLPLAIRRNYKRPVILHHHHGRMQIELFPRSCIRACRQLRVEERISLASYQVGFRPPHEAGPDARQVSAFGNRIFLCPGILPQPAEDKIASPGFMAYSCANSGVPSEYLLSAKASLPYSERPLVAGNCSSAPCGKIITVPVPSSRKKGAQTSRMALSRSPCGFDSITSR